jgi:flagellar biosynthesis protein FlhA
VFAADLNAGLIDEKEARNRRQLLERGADFYGAMDGAIRFVRGDAIAGILITVVNILGGFSIGVFRQDMQVGEAAQVYTLLTIGDGLVSQLPALVVSTAAGLVVTRTVSDKNLPQELIGQLLNQPYAFIITSIVLFFFGLIPGLPHFPFLVMSILAGTIGFNKFKDTSKRALIETRKREEQAKAPIPERVESILPLDIMELEVGYELIPLVEAEEQ